MNKQEGTEQQADGGRQGSVGVMLRQLRQEKGVSLRDVAEATNISTSNLVAIEHEQYADLPSNTFVRGQVAIYANFLGIDGAEAARRFIAERESQERSRPKKSARESGGMSAKKLAEPAQLSAATLAGGVLLLIILFIAGFSLYTGWNPLSFLMPHEQRPAAQIEASPEIQQHIPTGN
ncbi:helix-turn-helix domain-containing protein [Candidatus Electronema sp. TJ]|uniref:helix-turn-helix domain-containing protein n=1 Tax=Candidatus Electronema sp. TJ TaxID=3401573 RepID=UPI003AA9BCE4